MEVMIISLKVIWLLGAVIVFGYMMVVTLPDEMKVNPFFKHRDPLVCFIVSLLLALIIAVFWWVVPALYKQVGK